MLWDDFKRIKYYNVYINNLRWQFTFHENRIVINNKDNIDIFNSPVMIYDVSAYESYYKTFQTLINDINNLYFCKICRTLEFDYCKICKLNSEVDKLNIDFNEECPICYEKLTVRYITICNDIRHKICQKCNKINLHKCPICRDNKYKQQINYAYEDLENDNELNEEQNEEQNEEHNEEQNEEQNNEFNEE